MYFYTVKSFNLLLLSQTTLLLEEKLFARSVSHVHQSRHYYCVQVHHNDKKWCTNVDVNVIVITTGHCWSVSLSCWKWNEMKILEQPQTLTNGLVLAFQLNVEIWHFPGLLRASQLHQCRLSSTQPRLYAEWEISTSNIKLF